MAIYMYWIYVDIVVSMQVEKALDWGIPHPNPCPKEKPRTTHLECL